MYTILTKKRANSKKRDLPVASFSDNEIPKIIEYMNKSKLFASSPYFFTHLELSDGTMIKYIVTKIGISASPTLLREALEKQDLISKS